VRSMLQCELGPLVLEHPLINASGTLDLLELAEAVGNHVLSDPPLAAYVPKTVTLEARAGNIPPRIAEQPAGMLNSVGLPNEGIHEFLHSKLPAFMALGLPLIVNVAGFQVEEYRTLAGRVAQEVTLLAGPPPAWRSRVALELNVSCPNVERGGMAFGCARDSLTRVICGAREAWPGFLIVKLTPNVTDIVEMATAAVDAGADALALVNTFKGLTLDPTSLRPLLGGVTGGLSGPAVKPLALRCVYEVHAALNVGAGRGVPLIGMGGVTEVQDVLDLLACGASVVAVGAGLFRDPWLAAKLAGGLAEELLARGVGLTDLVGCAH